MTLTQYVGRAGGITRRRARRERLQRIAHTLRHLIAFAGLMVALLFVIHGAALWISGVR